MTEDEHIIFTGYRWDDGDRELFIGKTDDLLANQQFAVWGTSNSVYGNAEALGRDIEATADGSIYITGYLTQFVYGVNGNWDYLLLRVNANLELIWARSWGENGRTDVGLRMALTRNQDYVYVGMVL